jgi:hypothetical protein
LPPRTQPCPFDMGGMMGLFDQGRVSHIPGPVVGQPCGLQKTPRTLNPGDGRCHAVGDGEYRVESCHGLSPSIAAPGSFKMAMISGFNFPGVASTRYQSNPSLMVSENCLIQLLITTQDKIKSCFQTKCSLESIKLTVQLLEGTFLF